MNPVVLATRCVYLSCIFLHACFSLGRQCISLGYDPCLLNYTWHPRITMFFSFGLIARLEIVTFNFDNDYLVTEKPNVNVLFSFFIFFSDISSHSEVKSINFIFYKFYRFLDYKSTWFRARSIFNQNDYKRLKYKNVIFFFFHLSYKLYQIYRLNARMCGSSEKDGRSLNTFTVK